MSQGYSIARVKNKPDGPDEVEYIECSWSAYVLSHMTARIRFLLGLWRDREKPKPLGNSVIYPECLVKAIGMVLLFPIFHRFPRLLEVMARSYAEYSKIWLKIEYPLDRPATLRTLASIFQDVEFNRLEMVELEETVANFSEETQKWFAGLAWTWLSKDMEFMKTIRKLPFWVRAFFGFLSPTEVVRWKALSWSDESDVDMDERRSLAKAIIDEVNVDDLKTALVEALKWRSDESLTEFLEASQRGAVALSGRTLSIELQKNEGKARWLSVG